MTELVYLDASAAVKLIREEAETTALRAGFGMARAGVSSEVLEIEVHCAAHRGGGGALVARARDVCALVELIPLSASIRARALEAFDPPQGALDAVHLATAIELQIDALVLYSYDSRQLAGARNAGLAVASPA